MIKIFSNTIPFQGYIAITVWPLVFVRKKARVRFTEEVERHENIHGRQQRELLPVGIALCAILALTGCGWWSLLALPIALWLYILSYLLRLAWYRNHKKAYRNNPFEAEAYMYEDDCYYLSRRTPFYWVRFMFSTNTF